MTMTRQGDDLQFSHSQRMNPMVLVNAPSPSAVHHPGWVTPQKPPPITPQMYHAPEAPFQSFDGTADVNIKPVVTPQLPPDYCVLLLALADQYISAGRKLAPLIAHNQGGKVSKYHEFISAGLRCVECCLRHPNFTNRSPRQEATLQIKYASLLFEETVDYGPIEELLSKSIIFCERNRLLDLKYGMKHLMIRVLAKTNLSTAVKQADHVLSECEQLRYVPWIYAFQLLKASLLLQLPTSRHLHVVLVILRRLTDLARSRNDAEIIIASALMQAAVHLRLRKDDSILEAQSSLATARASLSNYEPKSLPQLFVLTYQLELACCLDPYDHQQAQSGLQALKQLMDSQLTGTNWRRDRACYLHISIAGFESLLSETGGVFMEVRGRGISLAFSWLGRVEAYSLGLLLGGLALFHRNARDGNCSALLKEALSATGDDKAIQDAPENVPLSLALEKASLGKLTRGLVLIQIAFACCSRSDWQGAQNVLQRTQKLLSNTQTTPAYFQAAVQYLQAMIYQACGNFDSALSLYRSPLLVQHTRDPTNLSTINMIGILAALNTLLIVLRPSHPQHDLVPALRDQLNAYFIGASSMTSRYPDLVSAHALVTAILRQTQDPGSGLEANTGSGKTAKNVVASKQALQTALNASKKANNALLKTLSLSYMHHLFFGGIVDDQALRIAQGGIVQAREAGSQMWVDIAEAKLAHIQGQRAGI